MKRVAWLFSAPASHQVARGLTLCALFDLQRLPSRSRKSRRVASTEAPHWGATPRARPGPAMETWVRFSAQSQAKERLFRYGGAVTVPLPV